MSCRKAGNNSSNSTADVNTSVGASVLDNIGMHYGDAVKRELVELNVEDTELSVKIKAWCSGPSFQAKKGTFLFFINRALGFRRSRISNTLKRRRPPRRPIRRLLVPETSARRLLRYPPRKGHAPIRLPFAGDRPEQGRRQRSSDQERGRVRGRGRGRAARVSKTRRRAREAWRESQLQSPGMLSEFPPHLLKGCLLTDPFWRTDPLADDGPSQSRRDHGSSFRRLKECCRHSEDEVRRIQAVKGRSEQARENRRPVANTRRTVPGDFAREHVNTWERNGADSRRRH